MKTLSNHINQFIIAVTLAASSAEALAQSAPSAVAPTVRNSYPGNMVGRVEFHHGTGSYIGSATVIKPRSILTAGHCVYDRTTGWSTKFVFKRGYYSGTQFSIKSASSLCVLSGYVSALKQNPNSNQAFANDTGGAILLSSAAAGSYAPATIGAPLLTSSSTYKLILGYGANSAAGHNGELLLANMSTSPYQTVLGSFKVNAGMGGEGGMSGGPVMAYTSSGWMVAGVHISGTSDPRYNAGCRAIDTATGNLINSTLR